MCKLGLILINVFCPCPFVYSVSLCHVMDDLGEVFLPHPRDVPQPQHHEVHPRECWRKAAGQTALLQKDHGA